MISLKINDIVILENRVYRIEKSKYSNGRMQWHRAIFKLLREKELTGLFLEQMKGGKIK